LRNKAKHSGFDQVRGGGIWVQAVTTETKGNAGLRDEDKQQEKDFPKMITDYGYTKPGKKLEGGQRLLAKKSSWLLVKEG